MNNGTHPSGPIAKRAGMLVRGAIVLLLATASTAWAQTPGRVEGTVVSAETGEPFSGVRVYIEGTGQGGLTDGRGRYSIAGVPAGAWTLVAEYIGRSEGRVTVTVQAGSIARADFRLPIQALALSAIVVSTTGEARRKAETPATISVIGGGEIREARPAHPSDVMNRVAGVWVSVTGGEGHMAAIRQPKTTNPVYLYLEDGVPTRSTGFFNHNALYEINIPQADRIEVLKGPSTALHGSDAIGGVINVGTRAPSAAPSFEISPEGGTHGWGRILASASTTAGANGLRADLNLTRTDGWRSGTAYDRESMTLRWDRTLGMGSRIRTVLSASRIDQRTAGSSAISREDFFDRPTANYTPISFRTVDALRLSTAYERVSGRSMLSLTPYVRWNSMEMLPNWSLTYDPVIYATGHRSLGLVARWRRDFEPMRSRLITGVDVDYSPGDRREQRIRTVREGRVFTSYAPIETVYDYDVTFKGVSPFLHAEAAPTERLRLTAGLRLDLVGYAYENPLGELQIGRHRRPASTTVRYEHISPKLGATYAFGPALGVFAAYGHGFRAPSEGQLFRQGQAANTIGLRPVLADNLEAGLRGEAMNRLSYEISAYRMTKKDDILGFTRPDGSVETVNAGETSHRGIELGLGVQLLEPLRVDASWSVARHTYQRWAPATTVVFSGNEMEDAPRQIGNVVTTFAPARLRGGRLAVEWSRIGSYWMDAGNTHRYDGHSLVGLQLNSPLPAGITLFGRVSNLLDERYAEGAAYTSARGEEFAPGSPRTIHLGLQFRTGDPGGGR